MKSMIAISLLALTSLAASPAFAQLPCEELKASIEAKLQANGVKTFTLTIVPKEEKSDLAVVGTCDGGTKKIVYKRG